MTTRDEARDRAIELLTVTARFIRENHLRRFSVDYDEASCDGECLAEDCINAAEALVSDQPRPSVSEDQGASRDHALTDGVALVKCGADLWISRELVQSLEWDRRHYMNGPGSSTLVITMADGAVHRIKHEPGYLDGTDAYAIERALTNA